MASEQGRRGAERHGEREVSMPTETRTHMRTARHTRTNGQVLQSQPSLRGVGYTRDAGRATQTRHLQSIVPAHLSPQRLPALRTTKTSPVWKPLGGVRMGMAR